MPTTITPNMHLPLPVVGEEPGPDYATDNNSAFSIVDAHNHAAGSGVQIGSDGISIQSDFPINHNNLTKIRSARFDDQSAPLSGPTDLSCAYFSGVDFYINDANGNQIQITAGGGVAGSPGSIGSLTSPASATYNAGSKTFIWQSDTNTPANMDGGSYIFRNITASSKGVTVSAPNSLAANYSMTWPAALPGAAKIMSLDNAGAIAANYAVDNSTIEISSNTIRVKADGITTNELAPGSVTYPVLTTLNEGTSSSCGAFTTSSTTFVDVTNLSVTFTVIARPIMFFLQPDAGGSSSNFGCQRASSNQTAAFLRITKDGTEKALFGIGATAANAGTPTFLLQMLYPVGSIMFLENATPGTYTYKLQAKTSSGSDTCFVNNCRIVIYEIG